MKNILTLLLTLLFLIFFISTLGFLASSRIEQPNSAGATLPKAHSVLISEGFTDINLGGSALLGCSEDDSFFTSYHFSATNRVGNEVDGTVCCGLIFKGCTLRY